MPARYSRSPSPAKVGFPVSRRSVLLGAAGVAGLAAVPSLAACSSSSSGGSSAAPASSAAAAGSSAAPSASGTVTIGSNYSDAVPKKAFADTVAAFTSKSGVQGSINTVDHNTFQENINSYLQGKPDDVFTWFAGYRMRFFAGQGLAGDISDVWNTIGGDFAEGFKNASTGDDGKQYFVPLYNYPWAVFYRPSVWKEKGYEIPKTLDALKTLGAQMKKDGLTPIALADKDGWPAMGTFDIINMRVNGYDFHVSLMAGKESWEDQKVKDVFNTWASILDIHTDANAALGATWQEAATTLDQKKSGMYLLGSFVGQQMTTAKGDFDFFPFPEINPDHGTDSIDAPIDGFMMAKKPKNEAGAKALLAFLGSADAANTYLATDPNDVAANKQADASKYNAVQKKAAELIGSTKNIAQFLDRDTRPDFASTVMIPSLQTFLKNPKDVDGLTKQIQSQAKTIFAS
jgi:multiple sugar transport system substrate-binding protein